MADGPRTARRPAVDWAHQVKALVDHPRYRQAEYLTLVCDNLNTHTRAALRPAPRLQFVFFSVRRTIL